MSPSFDDATTTCFRDFLMSSCDLVLPSSCITQSRTISLFSDPSHSFSWKQKKRWGCLDFLEHCTGANLSIGIGLCLGQSLHLGIPWFPIVQQVLGSTVALIPGCKSPCMILVTPWRVLPHLWMLPWEIDAALQNVTFPCYLWLICPFQLFFWTPV